MFVLRQSHPLVIGVNVKGFEAKQSKTKSSESNAMVFYPKHNNGLHLSFLQWCSKYESFLTPYIDSLWNTANECGVVLKYASFQKDMMHYIYKTSASRYSKFIFLDK